MADSILCPQVGQDLTEAKVVALHVKLGDSVKKGDIVAEVESEKASFEVEAFASGTVIALPYKVGDTATVLEPLVVLGQVGEPYGSSSPSSVASKQQKTSSVTASSDVSTRRATLAPQERTDTLRSSPLARRVAAEAGLDLAAIAGSGPYGAVVLRDVEAAVRQGGTLLRQRAGDSKGRTTLTVRSLKEGSGHPVIFIHGFGSDLSSWRPFVPKLTIGNPMIGIDLPGHGGSAAEEVESFDAMVADIASTLLAKGHKRIHLVGHSLGAAVAAAVADRSDIDVRSMTLLAPAGLSPRIDGYFIDGFLNASSEASLAQWMKRLVHLPAALPAAYIRATLNARTDKSLVEAQRRVAQTVFEGSTQLFSILEALGHFEGPCRIITGRRDSIIASDPHEHIPGHVALHRLDHVGHLPQIEAAELVGRLIAETIRAAG